MNARADMAVRVAKALGDATRFELFRRIASRREICCRDLTVMLRVSQATVSHHLKILSEAGLIASRRDGQFSYFRIRPEALADYGRALRISLAARGRRAPRAPPGRAQAGRGTRDAEPRAPRSRVTTRKEKRT